MKFEIQQKQLRAILNFAATKGIRYYLNGVCVTQGARGTILEATDGHVLGRLLISGEPMPDARVIIGTPDIKRLLGTKKESDTLVIFETDGLLVTARNLAGTITFSAIDAAFPDTDRVTPKKLDVITPAHFNPEFPIKFAAAAEALTGKKQMPTIYQQGESAAIVTLECEPLFIGVMMPMRSQFVAGTIPSWVGVQQ